MTALLSYIRCTALTIDGSRCRMAAIYRHRDGRLLCALHARRYRS